MKLDLTYKRAPGSAFGWFLTPGASEFKSEQADADLYLSDDCGNKDVFENWDGRRSTVSVAWGHIPAERQAFASWDGH